MLLYHGTDTRAVARILNEGIRPRPADGEGNWPTAPSKAGFVYLTSAFAPYYAMTSAFCPSLERGVNPVIFEVDLDLLDDGRLYPDEDFLEQRIRVSENLGQAVPPGWSCDVQASQDQWRESLRSLGTVGVHGGVPIDALTRYAVIDFGFSVIGGRPMTKCPVLYSLITATHAVSIAHHGQEGERLRGLQSFLMGDAPFLGSPLTSYNGGAEAFRRAVEEERRTSVTVHRVPRRSRA